MKALLKPVLAACQADPAFGSQAWEILPTIGARKPLKEAASHRRLGVFTWPVEMPDMGLGPWRCPSRRLSNYVTDVAEMVIGLGV